MHILKAFIDLCFGILNIQIDLFGYAFTLYSVFLYCTIGSLLLYLILRLWE